MSLELVIFQIDILTKKPWPASQVEGRVLARPKSHLVLVQGPESSINGTTITVILAVLEWDS